MWRLLLVLTLAQVGCFFRAELRCEGCALVTVAAPRPPRIPEDRRAVVVLVHGAFGFGPEWDPIRRAIEARPELAYWVFSWPGMFGGDLWRRAEAFRIALQATVDSLPRAARDVLVLAHSAGGSVADYAARRLVVPDGVRVHVALLDGARVSMANYHASSRVDTPLGISVSTTQDPTPGIPRGVDIESYDAADPPTTGDGQRHFPPEIGVVTPSGEHQHYLGRKVTHGEAVSLGGLPLIDRLAR